MMDRGSSDKYTKYLDRVERCTTGQLSAEVHLNSMLRTSEPEMFRADHFVQLLMTTSEYDESRMCVLGNLLEVEDINILHAVISALPVARAGQFSLNVVSSLNELLDYKLRHPRKTSLVREELERRKGLIMNWYVETISKPEIH